MKVEYSRPVLNNIELKKKYCNRVNHNENCVKHAFKCYRPNRKYTKNYLLARFPLFTWLFKYNVKNNMINDIISGITIGFVHIPQSMACSMLAYLPVYVGFYVSMFPVLIYVLFGTSRHLSIGTFPIPAIMTASTILKFEGILYPAENGNNLNIDPNFIANSTIGGRISIAMALTFLVGVIQVFQLIHNPTVYLQCSVTHYYVKTS